MTTVPRPTREQARRLLRQTRIIDLQKLAAETAALNRPPVIVVGKDGRLSASHLLQALIR